MDPAWEREVAASRPSFVDRLCRACEIFATPRPCAVSSARTEGLKCQIASNSDPHFAPNRDPCSDEEFERWTAFVLDGGSCG